MLQGAVDATVLQKRLGLLRAIGALAALLIVAACEPAAAPNVASVAPSTAKPIVIPPELMAKAYDYGFAQQIAENCADFRLDSSEKAAANAEIDAILKAQGISNPGPAIYRQLAPPAVIQQKAIEYIQRRGIVVTEGATWCAAGRKEIAERTGIGHFLIAR